MNKKMVICATLKELRDLKKYVPKFDICILDDAAQCPEPSALIPMTFHPRAYIMFGDSGGLPYLISPNSLARKFTRPLFTRICEALRSLRTQSGMLIPKLSVQHRMETDIFQWSNGRIYKNSIQSSAHVTNRLHTRSFGLFRMEYSISASPDDKLNFEINFITKLIKNIRELSNSRTPLSFGVVVTSYHQTSQLR